MDVLVLMGSANDYDVAKRVVPLFRRVGIDAHMTVAAAHRTPARVESLVRQAEADGAYGVICFAGMAAHLAGVVAGTTHLPVIGVPLASGALDGLDALLATVQMPSGVPVATMAIGPAGASNAAVFMARVIGCTRTDVAQALADYTAEMRAKVTDGAAKVEALAGEGA